LGKTAARIEMETTMTEDPLREVTDAGHITAALRRSGVLGDARVRNVTVESSRPTIVSRIIRLRLEYDGPAPDAPTTLVLKTGLPQSDGGIGATGRREVAFYTEIAPTVPGRIIPRCFGANWDPDTGTWHILLEDLTETHALPTEWPLPPTAAQCEIILAARARFHAAWWDDPRLGRSIGIRHDETTAEAYTRDLTTHFTRFVDLLGDRLTKERRTIFELYLSAAPRLFGRHRSHRNLTIMHGDAHVWNVFLPRDGGGDVRLFDWDGWRVSIASGDLAYMMATHWYPERRRLLERMLLDQYYAVLLENGVRGYSRDDLDNDYKLSALMQIATPVWQMAYNIPPWVWWSHLERVMLAFDDLGCRDLL
jgi:hypothetical protein